MKLKTIIIDGRTYAEVLDLKPIFISEGKEIAFDVPATVDRITQLNGEAMGHRRRADLAEEKLKTFEGLDDPAAAIQALKTIKNFDDKKLVDAGEVEKVKMEATKALEDRYAPIVAERDKLKNDLYSEKIGGSFARSKFIADKIAVPSDIIQSRFGNSFKIEDGKVIGYDPSGSKIYSRAKPGEPAEFEEALELLVDGYQHKNSILKGSGGNGGGAKPGAGANGLGRDISHLSPVERINAARAAR